MTDLADLLNRAHLPLFAVMLSAGLAIAAVARDLGKRLLGACVAAMAGVVELVALTRDNPALAGAALAACVLILAAAALGLALLVRVREGFGGLDAGGLHLAEAADDRAERGE